MYNLRNERNFLRGHVVKCASHGCDARVLVDADVARLEALLAGAVPAVEAVEVGAEQLVVVVVELHLQLAERERPEALGLLLGAPVDSGAVQEGRHLVDLLARTKGTSLRGKEQQK